MRIGNVIKGYLKLLASQFPIILLGCGLFPLGLALLSSQGMDSNFIEPTIHVMIIDEDQTEISKQLSGLFENEPFELVEEAATFVVSIPEGYEESILNHEFTILQIIESRDAGRRMKARLTLVIEEFHQLLGEIYLIDNSELKSNEEFMMQLNFINETNGVETEFPYLERDLPAFERWAIFSTSLVFATIIINLGIGKYTLEGQEITSRFHMFPLTKAQMYHYGLMESFLMALSFLFTSLLAFAIISLEIRTNLLNFIPVLLLSSVFAVFIAQMVCEFIPGKIGKAILISYMLSEWVISYMGIGLELIPQLSYFWPGMIIQHLYEGVLVNQWSEIKLYAVGIVVFSLFVYGLIRLKIFVKWGRQ